MQALAKPKKKRSTEAKPSVDLHQHKNTLGEQIAALGVQLETIRANIYGLQTLSADNNKRLSKIETGITFVQGGVAAVLFLMTLAALASKFME